MRIAGVVVAALTVASVIAWMPVASAQVPQIPATFYGSATIDGKAPPEGAPIRGFIDGIDCTQSGAMGSIDAGEVGAYVISVMHESHKAGCGHEGKRVTFTIDGKEAGQSAEWAAELHRLDLNAGAGNPRPLPPDVAIPNPGRTPGAAGDFAASPGGSASAPTPLPPGFDAEGTGEDSGSNVGAILLVAFGALGVGGGLAGWALSRRRTGSKDSPGGPGREDM